MISKNIFAQIILDFQAGNLPELLERDLKINLPLPIKRALVIFGPRRSGKTYFLFLLIKKILAGGVAKERTLYINFENPNLIGADVKDLVKLLEVFYELYPKNKNQKTFLFFDEIQNIPGWEVFIRHAIDAENTQIILSGSSSKLLSKEIATSLRGRTIAHLMLPFSFGEVLRAKNIAYEKYLSSADQSKIVKIFNNYLNNGGYPEIVLYPEGKEKIVGDIIEATIFKDLIERHKIRNIKVIKMMFQQLVRAKEFSVHQFFNFLKSMNIKVSKNSLYNYLEYFNDAFIFFPLRKFSYSLKEVEKSMPKIFTVDNALIDSVISNENGKKFENLVFLKLLQKEFVINRDLFYRKLSGGEIDFVIKEKGKVVLLMQSCFDLSDLQTKEREIKSLLQASDELSCNNLLLINNEEEKEEKFGKKTIKFVPLWKWLLE
ncbi:MAG: ATP-binding protein [Patescibacteria group bacterium]|nr:ATP-binding protein [Patescibacteria group bacterium]MBU4141539.1 ATP-binding protein [Patescibacteria group bacterium]